MTDPTTDALGPAEAVLRGPIGGPPAAEALSPGFLRPAFHPEEQTARARRAAPEAARAWDQALEAAGVRPADEAELLQAGVREACAEVADLVGCVYRGARAVLAGVDADRAQADRHADALARAVLRGLEREEAAAPVPSVAELAPRLARLLAGAAREGPEAERRLAGAWLDARHRVLEARRPLDAAGLCRRLAACQTADEAAGALEDATAGPDPTEDAGLLLEGVLGRTGALLLEAGEAEREGLATVPGPPGLPPRLALPPAFATRAGPGLRSLARTGASAEGRFPQTRTAVERLRSALGAALAAVRAFLSGPEGLAMAHTYVLATSVGTERFTVLLLTAFVGLAIGIAESGTAIGTAAVKHGAPQVKAAGLLVCLLTAPFALARRFLCLSTLFVALTPMLPAAVLLTRNVAGWGGRMPGGAAVRLLAVVQFLGPFVRAMQLDTRAHTPEEGRALISEARGDFGYDPGVPDTASAGVTSGWMLSMGAAGYLSTYAFDADRAAWLAESNPIDDPVAAVAAMSTVTGALLQGALVLGAFVLSGGSYDAARQQLDKMAATTVLASTVLTVLVPALLAALPGEGVAAAPVPGLVAIRLTFGVVLAAQFLVLAVCHEDARRLVLHVLREICLGACGAAALLGEWCLGSATRWFRLLQEGLAAFRQVTPLATAPAPARLGVLPDRTPAQLTDERAAVALYAATVVPLAVPADRMDLRLVDASLRARVPFEPLDGPPIGLHPPPTPGTGSVPELCAWLAHAHNYVMSNIARAARVSNPTTEATAVRQWRTKRRRQEQEEEKRRRR